MGWERGEGEGEKAKFQEGKRSRSGNHLLFCSSACWFVRNNRWCSLILLSKFVLFVLHVSAVIWFSI